MKTVWTVIVIVLIAAGAWYFLSMNKSASPSTQMGTNGSQNQGNLGQPDNGQVQQPGADGAEGSIIGSNLALGTSASGSLGTHLVGYNGMTVYTKSDDSASASTCYGTCATNWPPYLVGPEDNISQLKAGVTGKTGTITRTDGSLQMTYNGKPLYFYVGDKTSADVKGDGLGGVWHVAKP